MRRFSTVKDKQQRLIEAQPIQDRIVFLFMDEHKMSMLRERWRLKSSMVNRWVEGARREKIVFFAESHKPIHQERTSMFKLVTEYTISRLILMGSMTVNTMRMKTKKRRNRRYRQPGDISIRSLTKKQGNIELFFSSFQQ